VDDTSPKSLPSAELLILTDGFDIDLDVPDDELERTSDKNCILNSSVPWFQDWIQNDRITSEGRGGF
jgi:hypothetical protein